LIVERQDKAAIPLLKELLRRARLRKAVCTRCGRWKACLP
jgi:hypothetical protein